MVSELLDEVQVEGESTNMQYLDSDHYKGCRVGSILLTAFKTLKNENNRLGVAYCQLKAYSQSQILYDSFEIDS